MSDDFIDVDPDTGEVLSPAAPVPAVIDHTYRPSLVLAPEAASALVHDIKELQRSVLVKGTDYDNIPGVRGAPVLLKPGAERLLQVFGLGHRMECMDTQRDENGRAVGVTYRCTVTKAMGDGREVVVSSCDGNASHEEPKWKKAPWNTVIKMAQKRALVGATLTATATSGLFTQDMEDYEYEHPREGRSAPQPSRGGTGGPPPEDPNLVSKAQLGMMLAIMGKVGIHDRNIRLQFVRDLIDRPIDSSKDLTKAEASKVIDKLKEMEQEEAGDD